MYKIKSINLVTATVHEDTEKNGLLTGLRYYISVSKPVFTVVVLDESPCP